MITISIMGSIFLFIDQSNNSVPDPVISLTVFVSIASLLFIMLRYKVWSKLILSKKRVQKMLIEDILKQLYHVESSGRKASLMTLAGALKISDQKIVPLIELMSNSNLIKTEKDSLVLTPDGKDYALKIIRIHRLWEKYLSEKTGIDKKEWHHLAEEKEHKLSVEETDKLSRELGNPRFDPHGDPIPTKRGEIYLSRWKHLPSLQPHVPARIVHIEDEPEVIYRQIISNKLHIGSQIIITESDDYQIHFTSEGNEYSLSHVVASNISVLELNEEEIYEDQKVRLSSLEDGYKATVVGISSECRGAIRRRLLDLGFINGTKVETEFSSPDKNPRAYKIRNTLIALRSDQADLILIEKE